MMNYTSNGVSIATVLEKVKEKKRKNANQITKELSKEDYYYVRVRVIYKQKISYFTTGKKITKTDWQTLAKTKSKKMLEVRKDIEIRFDIIKNAVRDLIFRNEFSFENLKQSLSASPNKKEASDNPINSQNRTETLDNFINAKIKSLRENQQIGTSNIYVSALASTNRLMGKNILLTDVTIEWLRTYERKALNEGLAYSTIGFYLRNIQHMMRLAVKQEIITEKQYPFGGDKYIIPVSESRKIALTIDELKAIINCKDLTQQAEKYRDLWLFSYYLNGANFADIFRLKYNNIQDDEINFYRQKTIRKSRIKKLIRVSLTSEMKAIIKKWGNPNLSPNNYIFADLLDDETAEKKHKSVGKYVRYCNRHMTNIGKKIGINRPITTYSARHTYATLLKHRGANIAYISESLGHKDLKTTEHYLASFGKEERQKNARLLNPFL